MKAEILKLAGVKTEKQFYKKFPTEESFVKKHGKQLEKLKKAQVGAMVQENTAPTSNLKPIRYDQTYFDDTVASLIGGKTVAEKNAINAQNAQSNNVAPASNKPDISGFIGQLSGMLNMNGGADGAAIPEMQQGGNLKGFLKQNAGNIASTAFDYIDTRKAQKNKLESLQQLSQVSDVALQAARTRPEEIERQYVRPEDMETSGEKTFPIYGVGTNVLAKNGGMFANDEYMPIENVNQTKAYGMGGYLSKAKFGFSAPSMGNLSFGGGDTGSMGSQFSQILGADTDAGGQLGGKIGGTIGSLFGPAGSAVGGAAGQFIGGMLDRQDHLANKAQSEIDRNVKNLQYSQIGSDIQAKNSSVMKNGGNANPSMLDTMAMGGEIKTLWGGEPNVVSYNPYAGGESIQFEGNSHDYRDPETGQTGIGVAYGDSDVANNSASVEVEREPAQKLKDGGGEENLVVYGDLKIPKQFINLLGDENAKGKKFKHYVEDLNKQEAKINKTMGNAVDNVSGGNTIWDTLERNTADAIIKGGDMKLKSIADKKIISADIQEALNSTFDEYGIKGNEFINKNKIVADPERMQNAKYGSNIPKAQDSAKVERNTNLKLNAPPTPETFDFETAAEAEKAGYKLVEGKWISEETTDPVEKEMLKADALKDIRKGQRTNTETGLLGDVSLEDFNKVKEENAWYDWENFDPKNKEQVLDYQNEFNERARKAGSKAYIKPDGKFGEQTASARYTETQETTPAKTNIKTATVRPEEEITPIEKETSAKKNPLDLGLISNILDRMNRREDEGLDANQILPKMLAAAQNQVTPVQAQGFQPRLRSPYDISYQDQMNEIIAANRASQRNANLTGNPAYATMAQAPTYEAINKVKGQEFRANQAMRDNVYSSNIDAINKANAANLEIYDQQANRQARAVSNTKATSNEIIKSIADKYNQNKALNRLERVYENMYPNYRFDEGFAARNRGLTKFNTTGNQQTGSNQPSMSTPGFNPNAGNTNLNTKNTNPNNNISPDSVIKNVNYFKELFFPTKPRIRNSAFNMEQYNTDDASQSFGKSAKNGYKVSKNTKNSNVVRALKNI